MRRRLSLATRKELIEAVRKRYQEAALATKTDILDEFVELTGYHRKHAVRLLGPSAGQKREEEVALGEPHLQRCRSRSVDFALGGLRSDLRQTIEGSCSDFA